MKITDEKYYDINKIKNTIIEGDTIDNLKKIPDESVDLIFADPPYFMQTEGERHRTDGTKFQRLHPHCMRKNLLSSPCPNLSFRTLRADRIQRRLQGEWK